jgi:monomeric sarcosine oxidase
VADADVIVVGAGLAGAAAARELARAGRDVLLLEQFDLNHNRGSSHGASRIFRFSYDDPYYVAMAMDTLPRWHELEDEVGEQLLFTTGGVDCGGSLDGHVAALGRCEARFELLDPSEAVARVPALAFSGEKILLQPDAGYLLAERCVAALVTSATQHGATFKSGSRVRSVRAEGDGAVVEGDGGVWRAPVAVVAAGGWVNGVLADAGIVLPVTPTRQTIAYFSLRDDVVIPSLVDWEHRFAMYALMSPGDGLKAGEHHAGPVTDPDEAGAPDERSVERISEWVSERYPVADPEPKRAETCIYTSTADEHFILERHGPIVVGSACSGHGFKFGPTTGARLAELATTGRDPRAR